MENTGEKISKTEFDSYEEEFGRLQFDELDIRHVRLTWLHPLYGMFTCMRLVKMCVVIGIALAFAFPFWLAATLSTGFCLLVRLATVPYVLTGFKCLEYARRRRQLALRLADFNRRLDTLSVGDDIEPFRTEHRALSWQLRSEFRTMQTEAKFESMIRNRPFYERLFP